MLEDNSVGKVSAPGAWGPEFDPRTHDKADMVTPSSNPQAGEAEASRFLELTGQPA